MSGICFKFTADQVSDYQLRRPPSLIIFSKDWLIMIHNKSVLAVILKISKSCPDYGSGPNY